MAVIAVDVHDHPDQLEAIVEISSGGPRATRKVARLWRPEWPLDRTPEVQFVLMPRSLKYLAFTHPDHRLFTVLGLLKLPSSTMVAQSRVAIFRH